MISKWMNLYNTNPNLRQTVVASTVSVGIFVLSLPETLLISQYKKFLAKYSNDEVEKVSDELGTKIEGVLDTILIPEESEVLIDFFNPVGIDPIHKGSCLMRTGAIVGIPATYSYKSTKEVETSALKLNKNFIDWYSDAGYRLKNSLVLSENAKNFAIAREIFSITDNHIYGEAGLKSGFFILAYGCGYFLNAKYQLRKIMKVWGRLALYTFLGSVSFLMYIIVSDTYKCFRDDKMDKLASNLGSDYAKGGLEYYTKQISRNLALRELLGAVGPSTYSIYGNELSSWRRSGVELSKRKDNLKKIYENSDKSLTSKSSIKMRENRDKLATREIMDAKTTVNKLVEKSKETKS